MKHTVNNVLSEAIQVVQQRGNSYGKPSENFLLTSRLWSDYLGMKITPKDVGIMMILLKIAREAYKHTWDNSVDIAGYAYCLGEIEKENNESKEESVNG